MQTGTGKYRSTESKYKGGADEMYVTYDLDVKTKSGQHTTLPKIKRVYIAGKVKGWQKGVFTKRTGREVNGVQVEYEQTRQGYQRKAYAAKRGESGYKVSPASVSGSSQVFKQIVEIPKKASNVHFYSEAGRLPPEYRHALQNIR